MDPLALDSSAFADAIQSGRLHVCDLPRLCRDVGCSALDIPLSLLLGLDPLTTGPQFRGEMERRGVVLAAVRDTELCRLNVPPTHFGAPTWTTAFWEACARLSEGHWGAGLLVLTPPATASMGAWNTVSANLARARLISADWDLGLAIATAQTQGYLSFARDVPGLSLALDVDSLPQEGATRLQALETALPRVALVRVVADGSPEDARVLGAWQSLLAKGGFGGFMSVRYIGAGDPYSGAGTAIALLKSVPAPTIS